MYRGPGRRYARSGRKPGTKAGQGAYAVALAAVCGQHTQLSNVPSQYTSVNIHVDNLVHFCTVLNMKNTIGVLCTVYKIYKKITDPHRC